MGSGSSYPKVTSTGKQTLRIWTWMSLQTTTTPTAISIKDIIKLIKEQEGLAQSDYLTKEQVAVFLKKNLSKLLVKDDQVTLKRDSSAKDNLAMLE